MAIVISDKVDFRQMILSGTKRDTYTKGKFIE